jgi:hypothetical protein
MMLEPQEKTELARIGQNLHKIWEHYKYSTIRNKEKICSRYINIKIIARNNHRVKLNESKKLRQKEYQQICMAIKNILSTEWQNRRNVTLNSLEPN